MRPNHLMRSFFRLTPIVLVSLGMLGAAAESRAVSVSILNVTSSASSQGLVVGDTVTLDIGLANAIGGVYGVGISIYGYDRNLVELVSVETPETFLNEFTAPGAQPGGGFTNYATQQGYSYLPPEIAEIVRRGTAPRVELFEGVSLTPINGDGSLDRGVDGGFTGGGDAHARVTFRLIGVGTTTLSIGSDLISDAAILEGGAFISVVGTSYSLSTGIGLANPVPEPGAGVLLALGLGILAGRRTRDHAMPDR